MRINSDDPPTTASGMFDAIVKHAESDPLTRDILMIAEKDGMGDIEALVCLAYAALCAREVGDDCLKAIASSCGVIKSSDRE